MATMDYKQIIDGIGGYRQLAEAIQVNPERVRKWYERNRIPADYWMSVVKAANRSGHKVSLDHLAQIAGQ